MATPSFTGERRSGRQFAVPVGVVEQRETAGGEASRARGQRGAAPPGRGCEATCAHVHTRACERTPTRTTIQGTHCVPCSTTHRTGAGSNASQSIEALDGVGIKLSQSIEVSTDDRINFPE